MLFTNLFKISQADRNKFCQYLIDSSAPTADFYFLVVLSTLIVTMGVLANNIILVIGGMLVTPLLSPILALSLGILINEKKVIFRSLRIFFIAVLFTVVVSLIVGFFSPGSIVNLGLINLIRPSLISLLIALVAGVAASFTWIKPGLNDTLPGIAVTVTLIPPLTSIGLALSKAEWVIFRDSVSVLALNVTGIVVASLLVFALMDFYKAKQRVIKEVKEEEKEIKKAQKEAEKAKLESVQEKLELEKKKLEVAKKELELAKKKTTKK